MRATALTVLFERADLPTDIVIAQETSQDAIDHAAQVWRGIGLRYDGLFGGFVLGVVVELASRARSIRRR